MPGQNLRSMMALGSCHVLSQLVYVERGEINPNKGVSNPQGRELLGACEGMCPSARDRAISSILGYKQSYPSTVKEGALILVPREP